MRHFILLLLTVATLSAQLPNLALIEAEESVRAAFKEKFNKEPGLHERAMVHYAGSEIVKGRTNWEWVQHGDGVSAVICYEVIFQ